MFYYFITKLLLKATWKTYVIIFKLRIMTTLFVEMVENFHIYLTNRKPTAMIHQVTQKQARNIK